MLPTGRQRALSPPLRQAEPSQASLTFGSRGPDRSTGADLLTLDRGGEAEGARRRRDASRRRRR
eukprot:11606805-Alexandrium_andersonii.AAC.1